MALGGECGGVTVVQRSVGQNYIIHDMNNAVAGFDVRCDNPRVIDENRFIDEPDRKIGTVGGRCGLHGDYLGGRHFARHYVVGQDSDQLVLVFRQQQHFDSAFRQLGEGFISGREYGVRSIGL